MKVTMDLRLVRQAAEEGEGVVYEEGNLETKYDVVFDDDERNIFIIKGAFGNNPAKIVRKIDYLPAVVGRDREKAPDISIKGVTYIGKDS